MNFRGLYVDLFEEFEVVGVKRAILARMIFFGLTKKIPKAQKERP